MLESVFYEPFSVFDKHPQLFGSGYGGLLESAWAEANVLDAFGQKAVQIFWVNGFDSPKSEAKACKGNVEYEFTAQSDHILHSISRNVHIGEAA